MLVPVLTTSASTGVPLDLEVLGVELDCCVRRLLKDRNSHRARMNTPLSLSWWNTLDSMSASLFVELSQIGAFNLDDQEGTNLKAVLSADPCEVLHVRRREVLREQLGIVSAFSGANFDVTLHVVLLR